MKKNILIVLLLIAVVVLAVSYLVKSHSQSGENNIKQENQVNETYDSAASLFANQDVWLGGKTISVTADVRAVDLCADGENLDYSNSSCIGTFTIYDNKPYPSYFSPDENSGRYLKLADKQGKIYMDALRGSKCDVTCYPFPFGTSLNGKKFTLTGKITKVGSGINEYWLFSVDNVIKAK